MEDFRLSTVLFFIGVVGQLYATLEQVTRRTSNSIKRRHVLTTTKHKMTLSDREKSLAHCCCRCIAALPD